MSGGSFNYLARGMGWGGVIDALRTSTVERMRDALEELPEAQSALDDTNLFLRKVYELQKLADQLEPTWHAVEWWHSCDWGREQVVEALTEYERSRGLVVDCWATSCLSTEPPVQPNIPTEGKSDA